MRNLLKNIGVLFALLLTTSTVSFADTNSTSVPKIKNINSRFIVHGKESIDPRTENKIDEIGDELFVKTGINLYIYASINLTSKEFSDIKSKMEFIKSFEHNLTQKLDNPFTLLTLSFNEQYVNILSSDNLKSSYNKDDILDGYIIPILASHDKNSLESKLSLALLNGYSELADELAKSKGAELKSTLKGNGRTFAKYWKIFMYITVLGGLIFYFYGLLQSKKDNR